MNLPPQSLCIANCLLYTLKLHEQSQINILLFSLNTYDAYLKCLELHQKHQRNKQKMPHFLLVFFLHFISFLTDWEYINYHWQFLHLCSHQTTATLLIFSSTFFSRWRSSTKLMISISIFFAKFSASVLDVSNHTRRTSTIHG